MKLLGRYRFPQSHSPTFDYYHGHTLSEEERKRFNLYIKTISETEYEVWMDTREVCNRLVSDPPTSEEVKNYVKRSEEILNEMNLHFNSNEDVNTLTRLFSEREELPFVSEYYVKYT